MINYIVKRLFDVSLAGVGIIFSLPLWLLFSLLIAIEDGGSIFYIQERVGKDGKIFKGIKFRSMVPNAEDDLGPVQAQQEDARVTKIGKFLRKTALDELAQLWNIFKGEMSFVGPRPLRPIEIDMRDNRPKSAWEFVGFKERSSIKPGLTGVAQIFAPRDISRQEKFKYDIWYIKNQSFSLDLYLIILSFLITFRARWERRQDKFVYLAKGLKHRIETEMK